MQTNTRPATVEETDNDFMLGDYLLNLLNQYNEEFKSYFYEKCKEVTNYFANSPVNVTIKEWLFHSGNRSKFPLSAIDLFNNVKWLSRMTGASFIKQYNLANKLKLSSRWLRDIASRLKNLALLFSYKTNKINYCFTFNLNRPVCAFFDTLVALMFDHYSELLNTINADSANNITNFTQSAKSSSTSSSKPTSEPQSEFSLVKYLYTKLCDKPKQLEALLIPINKIKSKSKEGMHASVGSQPASQHFFINNFVAEEKEQLTVTNLFFNSRDGFDNNQTYKNTNNLKIVASTVNQNSISKPSATTSTTYFVGVNIAASKADENNKNDDSSSSINSGNNNSSNIDMTLKSPKHQEKAKSIHNYELCEKYTIEYAKGKLGSSDEIDDIKAFATYCFRSAEKDAWITAFVENNYVITSYNPLKNNEFEANDISNTQNTNSTQSIKKAKSSNKRQPNSANETLQTEVEKEILGKYPLNVYLDFIERVEEPRLRSLGREVYLAENLAKSMQNTGNDDKRVAKFVDQMKSASIGARANDFNFSSNNSFNSNNINSNSSLSLKANEFVERDKAIFAEIKEEFYSQIKLDSLRNELWNNLSVNEQQTLLNQEIKSLKSSKYFYSHYQYWTDTKLEEQAIYQVKKALANDVILGQGTMVASPINATLNQ